MEIGVDFIVKILFSMLFGALIGVESEVTNKFAGLRTHILVSLGACVFTILSIHGFPVDTDRYNADPARIAAQVVTGIGFIGGGTVLRMGNHIYGITTAATLWLAASVGMACGAGFYLLGALCSLLALFTLVVIRFMEFKFFPKSAKTATKIKAQIIAKSEDVKNIEGVVLKSIPEIYEISHKRDERDLNDNVKIVLKINTYSPNSVKNVYTKLNNCLNVDNIVVSELDE